MTNLNQAPPNYTLILSEGGDVNLTFVYQPMVVDGSGNPILVNGEPQYATANYPDGSIVTMFIDGQTEVTGIASISGSNALVNIPNTQVDNVKAGMTWRVVLTDATGVHTVIMNGTTQRSDGQ